MIIAALEKDQAGVANVETLTAFDNIDGGEGTDTLNVFAVGDLTVPSSTVIRNVEQVSMRAATDGTSADVTADLQEAVGIETLTVEGEAVVVNTEANVAAISITEADSAVLTDEAKTDTLASVALTDVAGAATITSDALTSLSLTETNEANTVTVTAAEGARSLALTLNELTNVTVADAEATAVEITTAGDDSTGFALTAAKAETISVTGDEDLELALTAKADAELTIAGNGAFTLTSSANALESIDASASTGGVDISALTLTNTAFTGGQGDDAVKLGANLENTSMGAGDDSVELTVDSLGGGSVDAGEGTDTLTISAANAATASAGSDFEKTISGFEKIELGAVVAGDSNTVDLSNLDDVDYVITAGTDTATGTSEVQSFTVTQGSDATGGQITVGGVSFAVAASLSTTDVAAAIVAQKAAIMTANANIADITAVGADVTVTYTNTAGDVALISTADNASGVTFAAVVEDTAGVTEIAEQQTITVGTAPAASGNITIGGVTVAVALGDTTAQTAAKIQAALDANKPANVASVSVATNVVTVTFAAGAGDVAALSTSINGAIFGGSDPVVANDAVSYVASAAEVQTVVITAGTDANGGEITVAGARLTLDANLSIDEVGTAVVSQLAAIQAADANISDVTFDTATGELTITYQATAGNVADAVVADNTSDVTFSATAEDTAGVAGNNAGVLNITKLANNGTVELTGVINGASSISMADATGAADTLNLKLNGADELVNNAALTVTGVETINIEATDSVSDTKVLNNADAVSQILLDAAATTTINLSGNHGVDFTGSVLTNLTTLDASAVVSVGDDKNATAAEIQAIGAVTVASVVTDENVSLTGGNGADVLDASSITDSSNVATLNGNDGDDSLTGGAGADVINGGSGEDQIIAGAGADVLSGGAGNDTFTLLTATDSVLDSRDVISDFSANTYGLGLNGKVDELGGVAANNDDATGDVININAILDGAVTGIDVSVQNNAADAQTFIQNTADAGTETGIALDSSTGLLYIDTDSNGTIDSVIELTGVTTIDEAAFVI